MTGSDVGIRQAEAGDLEAALGLLRRFFSEEGFVETVAGCMQDTLATILDHPDSAVLLATDSGHTIGIATTRIDRNLKFGRCGLVEHLYVLPEWRRRGVAAELLQAASDWSSAQSCRGLLVTFPQQGKEAESLIGYYTRRGFEQVGAHLFARTIELDQG